MSVRETLELDISEALNAIGQVGDRLENVAKSFGEVLSDSLAQALEGLPIITPEVDAAAVSGEVSQALEEAAADPVVVEADASSVADEVAAAVDDGVAAADTEVDLTVNVDTGDAQSQLDELGTSGEGAASGLEATGSAAGNASNPIDSMTDALTGLSASSVAAATGLGAVVAGFGFLYNAAFQSVAVTQQWETSLGPLGARIEDLAGGTTGLSTNLRQLAQDTGSSDEAVLIATQRYVEFQRSAGLADDQIVENTQNIAALAAQIRTNNPQLGTMDEIISALSRGLQRGGPRLQAYGISLNSAAIEAQALADTGKSTAAELTNAEKSAAGLKIAMDQVRPSADGLAAGMENVQIKSDRAREKFGDTLEAIGEATVEPITDGMLKLAEAFEVVGAFGARVANAIGEDLAQALEIAGRLAGPSIRLLELLASTLGDVDQNASEASGGVEGSSSAVDGMKRAALNAGGPLGTMVNVMTDVAGAFVGSEGPIADTTTTVLGMSDAAERLGISVLPMEEFAIRLREGMEATQAQSEFANQALTGLVDAAAANIPLVASQFIELNETTSADTIRANLAEQVALTDQWTKDMAATQAAGYNFTTLLLAQLGPERARLLMEQYGGQLADLERHLLEVYNAEQRARNMVNLLALTKFLELRGLTEREVRAIVGKYEAELNLGLPTAEAVDEAIAAMRARRQDLVDRGAELQNAIEVGFTTDEGRWFRLGEDKVRGIIAGIKSESAFVGGIMEDVVNVAYEKANAKAERNSPSKLFARLGRDLSLGLAVGIDEGAGQVSSAAAGLITQGAGAVGSSGGFVTAGATFNVSVPVTVTAGMTPEDGRAIGEAAGRAAGAELLTVLRMEAVAA